MIPICLTIAGSDSGGGAGIQADLKTFAALNCYGTSAITALTAQNTQGVVDVVSIKPEFVKSQISAVLDDMPVSAIKIGMLYHPDIARAVVDALTGTGIPIILDPVLTASSGKSLTMGDLPSAIKELLFPICSLITPNVVEAAELAELEIQSTGDIERAGGQLLERGVDYVLITGGDKRGSQKSDCLVFKAGRDTSQKRWFQHPEIVTQNSHGTGCTLSSAITAYIAIGESPQKAVEKGIGYTLACLNGSALFKTGNGRGGMDHFYQHRKQDDYE